jgi:hypothetical protein
LQENPDRKLRVLVVWEPILTTDWAPPSGGTLARISDVRAEQFWDRDHVVASSLAPIAQHLPSARQPGCCIQRGFYWDDAILFPAGSLWSASLPVSFWDGPVVNALHALQNLLDEQTNNAQNPRSGGAHEPGSP